MAACWLIHDDFCGKMGGFGRFFGFCVVNIRRGMVLCGRLDRLGIIWSSLVEVGDDFCREHWR